MIVKHKKGNHRSQFRWPKRVKGLTYKVTFNETCKYWHGDQDQRDYNKLFGIKRNYLRPRRNSIMGAWRYRDDLDLFEICTYQHDYRGMVYTHDRKLVRLGESVKFKFYDIHKGWLLLPWYGGQKKAPHDITFKVEFI